MSNRNLGFTARLVELFVDSRLSLLLLLAAVAAGAAGLTLTPREEEPQIIVPMVDVFTQYPGATPADVERNVVIPLENLLRGLPGVEHIYSHAREGSALVSVRFTVGYNREQALVDTFTRIDAYRDRAPAGVTGWVVRPVDVDDVPILTLALSGSDLTTPQLRRIAEELVDELSAVEDAAMAHIIGGQPETLEVVADLAALEARRITLVELADALAINNQEQVVGRLRRSGQTLRVAAGSFLHSIEDVEQVVVAVRSGRAVHLRDVAEVRRGPSDVDNYTRLAFGPAAAQVGLIAARGVELGERPAITIAIAKRRGANAVRVTDQLLERVELSRGSILPSDLLVTVTRNDGNTANEKVNELVGHILVAILTVVLVLVIGLGWREALVVAIAVPVTFSVALFMDLVVGYTINRVTLFSLVLSLGLLVDDPIVDVENIHRHFKLGRRSARDAVIFAVNEVRPPLIMATLTVIVSFLPMFFITGMMGPYMAPMPFNIGVVMLTSLVVALTVTPWAALRLLRYPHANAASPDDATGDLDAAADNWMGRLYQRVVRFFLVAPRRVWLFLALVGVFFLGSVSLAGLGIVPLKMLPFADQNRMQLVIDAPEGTTLEDTDALVRELSAFLRTVPEVTYVTSYVGLASAHDFVGLVRHSFLRSGDEVGDLRFGLLPKEERAMQSHAIALRLRPELERIAARHGSQLTLVEVPPGPPVLQTIVAEVTAPAGSTWEEQVATARDVRAFFASIPGLVDIDWWVPETPSSPRVTIDRDLAGSRGIAIQDAVRTLALALGRPSTTDVLEPGERNPTPLTLLLPLATRSRVGDLLALPLSFSDTGRPLRLGAVAQASSQPLHLPITRKDLERVVFVTADTAGISPADAVFALQAAEKAAPLPRGYAMNLSGEGEWKITIDVFRDLGLAFAAALAGIYILLVGQTGSLAVPLVMMVAIPITAIGIFPGFWLINAVSEGRVGSYANPTYFTATAMIGMIALAGIVVRNSVILVDFIEVLRKRGASVADAVLGAGAVRLRPIVLTAATSLLGIWVMALDPVFSGLAWSFIFGILASTSFTLVVVPLIYWLLNRSKDSLDA